ncbi:tRNA lysidine(34) synthetase TilS [Candidatus Marithrix sp. Canyon 246]|uniref:tRNA lysidine(34) synthetase TilS n=1 Tax=Candidatus Marithrix sp. Canyon 246 TaxID=1827136 RepID=UPI00084A28A9|nr:tRNA lysidine(34) synthetase TilS [Candidatus Marithrix sp. Canyon 246]
MLSLPDILHICPSTKRLWVAYSGGLDSHVLLHLLAQSDLQLRAIHINHGLNPDADYWAEHCQKVCKALDVPCDIIKVKVEVAARESLEAKARTARYQAILQTITPDDVVLTAQHADDQAETLLLQLLRGSGVAGLAAMPENKGWLVRPLLGYTRAELYQYAQAANLKWIEDSSNADTRFDRNFLRHEIMPRLQQRWASVSHIISRAASHQAEANELIQELAAQDLQQCQGHKADILSLDKLSKFSAARQKNVLRFWIKKLALPSPTTKQLQQIVSNLMTAKADSQPLVSWQGAEIRRYRRNLFAMPNLPPPPSPTKTIKWLVSSPSPRLPLGNLKLTQALPSGTELEIRFRQGGEVIRLNKHQRVVKKLLQAAGLPPWQRQFIPFIYLDNVLVAIPGIAEENGWDIEWITN